MIANSRENVYFGYTASELNQQFGDKKYVFTFKIIQDLYRNLVINNVSLKINEKY